MANETRTVEIIINGQKANASLKELSAAAAVMKNQLNKMAADNPDRAKLIKDFQVMKDRISGVNAEINGVTKATGFMKAGFQTAMGALLPLLSIQAVFGFLTKSKEDFESADKAANQLKATLQSTGHAAGITFSEIEALAGKLQDKRLIDADETIGSAALLGTFTAIKKGVFEEALPAIQDLATKMAGDGPVDLKGATIQVGKALNDPIKGITALSKVGVSFTEQQKETIKSMVAMGDTAGAQQLILAELNKEFGGSAEAAAKTGTGMKRFALLLEDVREWVGEKLVKALNTLGNFFGIVIEKSNPVVAVFREVWNVVSELFSLIGDVIDSFGAFNSEASMAETVVNLLTAAFKLILYPVKIVVQMVKGLVEGFIYLYNSSEMLRGTLGGLGAVAVQVFTNIKDAATKILGGVGDLLVGIFTFDVEKIKAGLKSSFSGMGDTLTGLGKGVGQAFAQGYEDGAGNYILVGFDRVSAEEEAEAVKNILDNSGADALALTEEQKKKLLEAQKKYREASARAEYDLHALKIELMQEGIDKVLAKLQLQHERELAEIEKKKAAALELEKISVEEKQALVDTYNEEAILKQEQYDLTVREAKAEATQVAAEEDFELRTELEQEQFEMAQELIEERFLQGLDSEAEREASLYELKRQALLSQLELIKKFHGEESIEYQRAKNAILAMAKTQAEKEKAIEQEKKDFKVKMGLMTTAAGQEVLQFALERLNQESHAYGLAKSAMKAFALVEIALNLQRELSANAVTAAEMNAVSAGVAGTAWLPVANATAYIRAALGAAKVIGFAEGGPTGDGLRVSGNGRMIDHTGHAIAGVVHDNEWVGPKWMYQSPKYAPIFDYLEGERQRGFAAGGPTSNAGPVSGAISDTSGIIEGLQVIAGLLSGYHQQVSTWQRELQVVNDIRETDERLTELKRVRQAGISG